MQADLCCGRGLAVAEEPLLLQAVEPLLWQEAYCGRGTLTVAGRGTLIMARALLWQRNHYGGGPGTLNYGRSLTVVRDPFWWRAGYAYKENAPTGPTGSLLVVGGDMILCHTVSS